MENAYQESADMKASNTEANCPKCDNTSVTLSNPLQPKKRKVCIIVSVIVLIAIVLFAWYGIWWCPLKESAEAYGEAMACEENLDFETAIYYYSNVIERDSNYPNALNKIEKLKLELNNAKHVAKFCLALKNSIIVTAPGEMDEIRYSSTELTCKVKGIGYTVSADKKSKPEYFEYYTTEWDDITNLYVTEYKAGWEYNGWLTSTTNDIRQTTSDILFEIDQLSTKETDCNIALVEKILEDYKKDHDISVFE